MALTAVLLTSSGGTAAADDWSPPGTKIDDWAECLRASDPSQRAEACTAILGKTRDRRSVLRALNGRGNALCATAERCAEAVPDFSAVVKLAPEIAGYHDNLARALRAASRFQEALAESDRAIALAPKAAFAYVGKAKTFAAAKRGDESVHTIEAAKAMAPQDAGLLEYEGKLLGDLGRYPESYAAFDEALKMQPQRVGVYVRRADVEAAEGRTDDAIRDLERYPASGGEADGVRRRLDVLRASRDRRIVDGSKLVSDGLGDRVVTEQSRAPQPALTTRSTSKEPAATAAAVGTSCNLHDWLPLQRCVEEYHNENDPLPGGLVNPRRWNEGLAAKGRALSEKHPEITWDRSAWEKLAAEASDAAGTGGTRRDAAAERVAESARPSRDQPPSSNASSVGSNAPIDTCDAPGVLSVIRDLSNKAMKEQAFMLLYANIVDAHFEFTGIRQLSYDREAEHRECAMDRKLAVTYYAGTQRPPGKLDVPIRYEVDRQLDGDRGSYVTCKCDR